MAQSDPNFMTSPSSQLEKIKCTGKKKKKMCIQICKHIHSVPRIEFRFIFGLDVRFISTRSTSSEERQPLKDCWVFNTYATLCFFRGYNNVMQYITFYWS